MTPQEGKFGANPLRPLLRSLLQKAVRRGYQDLAEKVAFLLGHHGDSTWLHTRTGVIIFEECWPLGDLLIRGSPSAMSLRDVAASVKNKDAAGLGALAQVASEGDITAIEQSLDAVAVKIVAAALKRPESFFRWATDQCTSERQAAIVRAAQHFFPRATWPWDKAFMAAAAYLAIKAGVPPVAKSELPPADPFPFWTAADRHTPQGKAALRKIARGMHIPESHLQWANFYFESARTQAIVDCPWWKCESTWRLGTLGLSTEAAEDIWAEARPRMESAVRDEAEVLQELLLADASQPM